MSKLNKNNTISNFTENALEEVLNQQQEKKCSLSHKQKNILAICVSVATGLGAGFAMTPVFNDEVRGIESIGLDIHDSQAAFIASTINTILIFGWLFGSETYKYIMYPRVEIKNNIPCFNLAKISCVLTALVPIAQLWNAEMHNKHVAKTEGFDVYMQWGTAFTVPLFFGKMCTNIRDFQECILDKKKPHVKNNTIGSTITTYLLSIFSGVGYGLAVYDITDEATSAIDIDNTFIEILKIVTAGFFGCVATYKSYIMLDDIMHKKIEKYTWKDCLKTVIAAVEGSWLCLPLLANAEQSIKDVPSLIKSLILYPFFLSDVQAHATSIVDTMYIGSDTESVDDVL